MYVSQAACKFWQQQQQRHQRRCFKQHVLRLKSTMNDHRIPLSESLGSGWKARCVCGQEICSEDEFSDVEKDGPRKARGLRARKTDQQDKKLVQSLLKRLQKD